MRLSLVFVAALFFALTAAVCRAACPIPAPASSPSAPPEVSPQGPLYQQTDDIYTLNRDGTLFYSFQGNRNGTAKAKEEFRYGRSLWNGCAQLRIRIPVVTKYVLTGIPHTGLGNVELGYGYYVPGPTFNHSIEFRIVAPTNANGVDDTDTEIKGLYNVTWKWPGFAIGYNNEYDQSVIKPPTGTWTSYYEGKLSFPEYAFVNALKGFNLSVFYNYRVLFDSGGLFKDAIGATTFGSMNNVAWSVTDSWGLGGNGLWKFRFEANVTAKF